MVKTSSNLALYYRYYFLNLGSSSQAIERGLILICFDPNLCLRFTCISTDQTKTTCGQPMVILECKHVFHLYLRVFSLSIPLLDRTKHFWIMPLDMICPVIRTPTLHLVANRIPEICLFWINIVTYFDRMEDIDHSSGMRTIIK